MWKTVFALCVTLFLNANAHVQLLYPPATLNLDFLDNFRTSGICGHEPTGVERTEEWRLPEVDNNTVTSIQTGSNLTVNWALHYAHQGGWLFELYNADGELTSTWNSSDHWDCTSDSTQQEAILQMPETTCEGCILRLRRQALEWGEGYRFHSCALVDIVDDPEDACNGCSGNGRCVRGSCRCFNSTRRGFWYGDHCERQNECELDEHCGEFGVCVDTGNITPPNKQCYCQEGYFGSEEKPIRGSDIVVRTCTRESNLTLGNPRKWEEEYDFMHTSPGRGLFKVFYSLDQDNEEIEFAIRARTENWVAIGFRPIATGETEEKPTRRGRRSRRSRSKEETESEETTESEGNSESEETTESDDDDDEETTRSGRRGLRHLHAMPQIQEEAEGVSISKRSLLQNRRRRKSNDDDDSPSEEKEDADDGASEGEDDTDDGASEGDNESDDGASEGDNDTDDGASEGDDDSDDGSSEGEDDYEHEDGEGEGEGDGEAEGEGEGEGDAEGEGDGDQFCEDGDPTTTEFDEGLHNLIKPRRRRGNRGLKVHTMPLLEEEKPSDLSSKNARSLLQNRRRRQAEDDDESPADEKDDSDDSASEGEDDYEHEDDEGEAEGEGDGEAEGEGEGDGEAEGEGDDDDDKEDEFVPELIAEGTECEAAAVHPSAHAMINQDVIIAYAKDGIFRIQDSFTPSRAKPLPDSYFGGDDGIIDAVGNQDGRYTNIKFRRKLTSLDGFGDYCILPEVDYFLIYAYGQHSRRYSHNPDSGLETGRASNKNFYGEDELKYHGGGIGTTFEGRGSFGSVNFFDDPPEVREPNEGCLESTMEDYDCMQEALGDDFVIHWSVEEDGVSFAAATSGTGWIGVGWPETTGVMVGAEAVISLGGDSPSASTYLLESRAVTGITEDTTLFDIEDAEFETNDDGSVLKFKRLFDEKFNGQGETDFVVAFHPTANELAYHGPTTRGGVQIVF